MPFHYVHLPSSKKGEPLSQMDGLQRQSGNSGAPLWLQLAINRMQGRHKATGLLRPALSSPYMSSFSKDVKELVLQDEAHAPLAFKVPYLCFSQSRLSEETFKSFAACYGSHAKLPAAQSPQRQPRCS